MNNTLSQKSLWITVGDNLLAIIKVLCFRKLIGKPAFLFMTWHDTVLDFGLVRERWSPLANYCWTQKCVEGIAWKEAQLDWSWKAISYSLQLLTVVDHRTDSCVTAAHRDTSNLLLSTTTLQSSEWRSEPQMLYWGPRPNTGCTWRFWCRRLDFWTLLSSVVGLIRGMDDHLLEAVKMWWGVRWWFEWLH